MLQKFVPFPPGNQAGIFIRAEIGSSYGYGVYSSSFALNGLKSSRILKLF